MITYLVRHGQTRYSARHLVNGDPTRCPHLDAVGVQACIELSPALPWNRIRSLITSAFPRARQTGELLRGSAKLPTHVEPLLNELDYGQFEGGPFLQYAEWLQTSGPFTRPQGARESQTEGIRRMLSGVLASLTRPGPRLLVAHGLLLSVLTWAQDNPKAELPLFMPEVACLTPLQLSDDRLGKLLSSIATVLDQASFESDTEWKPDKPAPSFLLPSTSNGPHPEETDPDA